MKTLESIINEEVALAVERIVRASRAVALAAFDQQFDQLRDQSQHQQVKPSPSATSGQRPRKRPAPQRSAEEIAALEARLLAAVHSNPGQSMAELASMVGVRSAELRVPVVRLKAKKQLKLVGQRQFASYFPADGHEAVT
jgi:hypothetical protein